MLRTCEEKQEFIKNIFKFVVISLYNLSKWLTQKELQISLDTCAPSSELPCNINKIVFTTVTAQNCSCRHQIFYWVFFFILNLIFILQLLVAFHIIWICNLCIWKIGFFVPFFNPVESVFLRSLHFWGLMFNLLAVLYLRYLTLVA